MNVLKNKIVQSIKNEVKELDVQALCDTVYYFTMASLCEPGLLDVCLHVFKPRAANIRARTSVRTLWAFAKHNRLPNDVLQDVANHVIKNIDDLEVTDYLRAFSVFALGKDHVDNDWNLEILLIKFLDQKDFQGLAPRDVDEAAVALAYLYHGPKASETLAALGNLFELPQPAATWNSESLTTLLWSMGVKYAWNEKLYKGLIDIVLSHESGEGPAADL